MVKERMRGKHERKGFLFLALKSPKGAPAPRLLACKPIFPRGIRQAANAPSDADARPQLRPHAPPPSMRGRRADCRCSLGAPAPRLQHAFEIEVYSEMENALLVSGVPRFFIGLGFPQIVSTYRISEIA